MQDTGANFHVFRRDGELQACMALWNQQPYKQVVARGYRAPLGALLPAYNLYAKLSKRVTLPGVGHSLDQSYLAFLAVAPGLDIVSLIEDALALSPTRTLAFGLHADHVWLPLLTRHFRPLSYRAGIYTVSFADEPVLDDRPAQPEVAIL
jgi:hypothetical protein